MGAGQNEDEILERLIREGYEKIAQLIREPEALLPYDPAKCPMVCEATRPGRRRETCG